MSRWLTQKEPVRYTNELKLLVKFANFGLVVCEICVCITSRKIDAADHKFTVLLSRQSNDNSSLLVYSPRRRCSAVTFECRQCINVEKR